MRALVDVVRPGDAADPAGEERIQRQGVGQVGRPYARDGRAVEHHRRRIAAHDSEIESRAGGRHSTCRLPHRGAAEAPAERERMHAFHDRDRIGQVVNRIVPRHRHDVVRRQRSGERERECHPPGAAVHVEAVARVEFLVVALHAETDLIEDGRSNGPVGAGGQNEIGRLETTVHEIEAGELRVARQVAPPQVEDAADRQARRRLPVDAAGRIDVRRPLRHGERQFLTEKIGVAQRPAAE